jgi:hypothetical protein
MRRRANFAADGVTSRSNALHHKADCPDLPLKTCKICGSQDHVVKTCPFDQNVDESTNNPDTVATAALPGGIDISTYREVFSNVNVNLTAQSDTPTWGSDETSTEGKAKDTGGGGDPPAGWSTNGKSKETFDAFWASLGVVPVAKPSTKAADPEW